MRDHSIPPVYVAVGKDGEIRARDDNGVSMEDVFGTPKIGADIRFEFETVFEPLSGLLHDALSGVDVVTRTADGEFCRPLEVKLTVVPDNTTAKQPEEKWCSELVIRPITSAYAAIQLFANLSEACRAEIRDIIGPVAFANTGPGQHRRNSPERRSDRPGDERNDRCLHRLSATVSGAADLEDSR